MNIDNLNVDFYFSEYANNGQLPTQLVIASPQPGTVIQGEIIGVSWASICPFFAYAILSIDSSPQSMVLGRATDSTFLRAPLPGNHTFTVDVYSNISTLMTSRTVRFVNVPTLIYSSMHMSLHPSTLATLATLFLPPVTNTLSHIHRI